MVCDMNVPATLEPAVEFLALCLANVALETQIGKSAQQIEVTKIVLGKLCSHKP